MRRGSCNIVAVSVSGHVDRRESERVRRIDLRFRATAAVYEGDERCLRVESVQVARQRSLFSWPC